VYRFIIIVVSGALLVSACAGMAGSHDLDSLHPANQNVSAAQIIAKAHKNAGGDTWRRPETLQMFGYGVFYNGLSSVVYEPYTMHRVYTNQKNAAHKANGKVRIEAKKDGQTIFLIAFDGSQTYNSNGLVDDQTANDQWASSFGYGAIRHALDGGWAQKRLPDDMVDGQPAYFIELTDPSGGKTQFGIAHNDYSILSVAFDTARGWHERHYSNFFSKPGINWKQPGRVRLFYDGVKSNEVIWTDFVLNEPILDERFIVEPRN